MCDSTSARNRQWTLYTLAPWPVQKLTGLNWWGDAGSYVTHETKHFIYFYLGQVAVLLFKSG